VRIAQVSPLYESVPPRLYGGTERVVSFLTEELVALGHQVTLFASGDSRTSAELVASTPTALRLQGGFGDPLAHHLRLIEQVYARADDFDLIHFHIDYIHFPTSRARGARHLTTLHGRLDAPELVPLYRTFSDMPLVSISDAQRRPLPFARWLGTVLHGLPRDLYRFHGGTGSYLAFLGRLSRDKGADRAIEIARRVRMPLKIAAKVDQTQLDYLDEIRPLLADPLVEFVGEIGETEKDAFLGGAAALLFPIDWPEPFGLVMVEAMACGTPVVAFRQGSVPEVVRNGVSGFIVGDVDEAARATEQAMLLSRRRVRQDFEARFDVRRMARAYVDIYTGLVASDLDAAPMPVPTAAEAS
jgi:glycosyltransferase involved in cell wall biosynthesis